MRACSCCRAPRSKRAVGGVLHQRVLEGVDRVRRRARGGRPAPTRRAAASASSSSLRGVSAATAAISSCENSRPIAAPISRDLPHRRQAVEPRHQRGMQRRRDGKRRQRRGQDVAVALARAARRSPGPSWSAPRRTTARRRCARRSDPRPPAAASCRRVTRPISAAASRRLSRLSGCTVTCGRPAHGGANSGRAVTISSTGRLVHPIDRCARAARARSGRSSARPRRPSAPAGAPPARRAAPAAPQGSPPCASAG